MRKILVIEDEQLLREAYVFMLSTEPYTVHAANNGQEALELCADNEYDLILLDLMMPVVNGSEFLEKFDVEKHPRTKVIMLTNISSGDELAKAMTLGAHRSVLKASLKPKELLSLVRYEVEAS